MKILRRRKSVRFRIWLGASLGIVVVAPWIYRLLDREPVYNGRKISDWLAVIARERVFENEGEAFDALRDAGPEVVPYLIDTLKSKRSRSDAIYNRVLEKLPEGLQHRLPPWRDPGYMRGKAQALLQIISPAGKQAAIPPLLQLFESPDFELREIVAEALTTFGTNSKPAVPKLLGYITNSDWGLRANARQVLVGIGPEATNAVAALVRLWQDKEMETEVREEVLDALNRIDHETWEKLRP